MEPPQAPRVVVQGQVCRTRALSKRLIFFDLLLSSGNDEEAAGGRSGGAAAADGGAAAAGGAAPPGPPPPRPPPPERWVEVVAKAAAFARVQEARDEIRIGDVVCFQGEFQDPPANSMLTCRGYAVVSRWRDAGGGRSFQPRVPPRRHSHGGGSGGGSGGGQQQQQQQQQRPGPGGAARPAPGAAPQVPAAPCGEQQAQAQQGRPEGQPEEGRKPGLCKFYVNSGRCLKGDACPYAHVAAEARGAALTAWVKRRCGAAAPAGSRRGAHPRAQQACRPCHLAPRHSLTALRPETWLPITPAPLGSQARRAARGGGAGGLLPHRGRVEQALPCAPVCAVPGGHVWRGRTQQRRRRAGHRRWALWGGSA
jgi:hypothetical protein